MRNLKKCISNFKEWVELPEHDIQAVMQLQLISPTGRTLAGTETNETLRKGGALFSNKL
ncbi:MAG: hypothetical protein M0Q41_08615 [Bacteroidales bacterium]|nr:hypothetical protein [Bacteroidales bacterium]MDD3702395.1 hypothetical protein [Bacteroidales bacterium]